MFVEKYKSRISINVGFYFGVGAFFHSLAQTVGDTRQHRDGTVSRDGFGRLNVEHTVVTAMQLVVNPDTVSIDIDI